MGHRTRGQLGCLAAAVLAIVFVESAQAGGPGAVDQPGAPGPAVTGGQPVVPPLIRRGPTTSPQKLRALVIHVKGRAQWRPSETAPWKNAKVNDILEAGADVRTGLRSSVALRVGKNATVLVDRATRLSLPVILQDGQTLRTRAAVRRGRADFKVDLIGLANDFEVLTPTTTLAVRGTGFAVKWGALRGAEMEALSAEVLAIEVRYLLTQLSYLMATGSVSSETMPNPVLAQLFQTFQKPLPSLTDAEYTSDLTNLGTLQDRVLQQGRRIEYGLTGVEGVEEFIDDMAFQMFCANVCEFFGTYRGALNEELGFGSFGQLEAFNDMVADVKAFCANPGTADDPFRRIQQEVSAFCQTYQDPADVARCIDLFQDLLQQGAEGP
ncbi:MAG: FecR domain-containing protein [Planctomycetota bacterium]|jgi:hypothetical protein